MCLWIRGKRQIVSVHPDQGEQASRAISVCSEVLQTNPENVNTLKDRAEAYIQEEHYEEGESARVLSVEANACYLSGNEA